MIPLSRANLHSSAGRGPVTFFLDLDGTLAPFVPRPAEARVGRTALSAIGRLRRAGHAVILVTGRRAHDAAAIAGPDLDAILGSHGAEWLDHFGLRPWLGTVTGRRAVAAAARRLRHLPAPAGVRLEDKEWSLAVHTPDPDHLATAIRARLRGLPVLMDVGRRVIDVRAPGVDKGRAVRRWLELARPRGAVIYAGDDATDEDAFRALRGRAATILVGRHATGARFHCTGPAAFGRWLHRLAERIA